MKKLSFTLFLFFTCCYQSFSQDSARYHQAFNRYYNKSVEKLRELYGIRGATFSCDIYNEPGKNYLREVKNFISEYKSVSRFIGVLFYSLENDSLNTWLYKNDSLFYSYTPATKEQLIENEYQLRTALQVTRMAANRAVIQRSQITDNTPPVSTAKKLSAAIKETTDLLLPNEIRNHLAGIKHLFIIPEFNIGQYPFQLLQPFNDSTYLIDRLSYSFVPHLCNLSIFATQHANEIGRANQLETISPLVVGNPAFSDNTGFRLISLPGAETEAKAIADSLGTTAIIGKDATLDTVIKLAKQSDILYFATHGYFDFEKIMDGSFLAFAPGKDNPTGLWTSRQIQTTPLTAKMAILSACQTGFGKVVPGGFIGLARAFYKAGVDFTVMSLWSVDDEKTKEFMLMYLQALQEPSYFYPASPLKKAINRFKKDNPDPVYWAAFSVFGFTY